MSRRLLYLTETQWDNRLKTIATKRLHKFHKTLTASSIGHYFRPKCVVVTQWEPNETITVVDEEAYKEMRDLFMNHSDDELREKGVII